MKCRLVALSACALVFSFSTAVQAQGIVAKQLSGPPDEFASMRSPDPADSAIYSKSALIPVEMKADASGRQSWTGKLPVENGQARFMVFSGGSNWQATLAAPGRNSGATRSLAATSRNTDFGIGQANVAGDLYVLDQAKSGEYSITLKGTAAGQRGFLLIEGDPATELVSYPTHRKLWVGERISFNAALVSESRGSTVLLGRGAIESAELRVTSPDGSVATHAMYDDGRHADGIAADGVFGGDFQASSAGSHVAQVIVHAIDGKGQRVLRSAEHVVPVVRNTLRQSGAALLAGKALEGTRLSIDTGVRAADDGAHYRAYAEVWGTSKGGAQVPVAWVAGMVTAKNGNLELGFDDRWVARAGAVAPFELRNLRVEDADNFVPLATTDRIALALPATSGRQADGAIPQIDEAMTMGVRPSGGDAVRGVGKRLLLVHGYCSGGVWPASQFSTASTFLDVNKNRSHDAFARLLQTFGSTWNSFGTVAHSQGGAAALHLYTYYWSGLDNATGSRLMQSVGTPYKGTNLAGILATLGSWFGVGCGNNSDLSYSGSAAWLAGIPTSARAKVNYYTTSFKFTNWWTNDYCNFATDLVLSDPEDGTTEQVNGQLSGGVNRGHTLGQCHTTGMRDPAQYLDSSRNATMNTNAAR